MKKGYTHITVVLDNSGSMAGVKERTIAGYNTFKKEQVEQPGKLTWSLYEFKEENTGIIGGGIPPFVMPTFPNNPIPPWGQPSAGFGVASASAVCGSMAIDPLAALSRPTTRRVWSVYEMQEAKGIPDLNIENYKCDTMTPLLDAIGVAIEQTGKWLSLMAEEDRPEKVIFVILTDGAENHSVQFTHEQVMANIKHQTDVYQWQFIYLGANQDAIQVGGGLGISAGASMSYNVHDAASYGATYAGLSATISGARGVDGPCGPIGFSNAIRAAAMGETVEVTI